MMNRIPFKYSQSMHLIHTSENGNQLWLGDYFAATNLTLLKQRNIKFVLTAADQLNIFYQKQHNISHKTINAHDLPSYKMTPHFDQAHKFIDLAMKKGHILVHCAAGISRSATIVIMYLMRSTGMNFRQSIDYVKNKRSKICPNYGFQNQLKKYQIILKNTQKGTQLSNLSTVTEQKGNKLFAYQQKGFQLKKQSMINSTLGQRRTNKTIHDQKDILKPKIIKGDRGKSTSYAYKTNLSFPTNFQNLILMNPKLKNLQILALKK